MFIPIDVSRYQPCSVTAIVMGGITVHASWYVGSVIRRITSRATADSPAERRTRTASPYVVIVANVRCASFSFIVWK